MSAGDSGRRSAGGRGRHGAQRRVQPFRPPAAARPARPGASARATAEARPGAPPRDGRAVRRRTPCPRRVRRAPATTACRTRVWRHDLRQDVRPPLPVDLHGSCPEGVDRQPRHHRGREVGKRQQDAVAGARPRRGEVAGEGADALGEFPVGEPDRGGRHRRSPGAPLRVVEEPVVEEWRASTVTSPASPVDERDGRQDGEEFPGGPDAARPRSGGPPSSRVRGRQSGDARPFQSHGRARRRPGGVDSTRREVEERLPSRRTPCAAGR